MLAVDEKHSPTVDTCLYIPLSLSVCVYVLLETWHIFSTTTLTQQLSRAISSEYRAQRRGCNPSTKKPQHACPRPHPCELQGYLSA